MIKKLFVTGILRILLIPQINSISAIEAENVKSVDADFEDDSNLEGGY